jgi:hypothetical protein
MIIDGSGKYGDSEYFVSAWLWLEPGLKIIVSRLFP